MTKKGKRNHNRLQGGIVHSKATIAPKGLHLTVGSTPTSKELSKLLENDLRLIKAGLLYADHIKLYSFPSWIIMQLLSLTELKFDQQLDFLEQTFQIVADNPDQRALLQRGFAQYREIKGTLRSTAQAQIWAFEFKSKMLKGWSDVDRVLRETAHQAGIESLLRAYQTGILEIHSFKGVDTDSQVHEYFDLVSKAISDGTTYPLVDDMTAELIRLALKEGKLEISDAGIARSKHGGLVGHLLQDLPLFEAASVDEIIDIRRELDRPLVQFRAAMIQFSEMVKSAPWDSDFPSEADSIFYQKVAPAINEIEDAVKSNKYLVALTRELVDKPLTIPGGSVLGLALSHLTSLPTGVAESIGIGLGAATVAYDAREVWKKEQIKIEQNQLFFYYHAAKQLSR